MSVGAKSDEYGGGRRTAHLNLIFSWVCWTAIVENKDDYIFDDNISINLTEICFSILLVKILLLLQHTHTHTHTHTRTYIYIYIYIYIYTLMEVNNRSNSDNLEKT